MTTPLQSEQLFGHEELKRFMLKSIKNNTLHNSYILKGFYGIGKETFALHAAILIFADGDENGARVFLKKMLNNTLDNFLYIKKDDAILLEDTKEISAFLSKKTEQRKCIIIDAVEKMTVQSANSILKSIEEAQNATFFLVTSFFERVISTIKSRSIILDFKPLDAKNVDSILMSLGGNIPNSIKAIAGGSVGVAFKIHALEKENKFLTIIVNNIISPTPKIETVLKDNIDIVMLVIAFLLEQLILGVNESDLIDWDKLFKKDKKNIFNVYEKIFGMYKNYQLYNLEKEAFLYCVFSEIGKLKI